MSRLACADVRYQPMYNLIQAAEDPPRFSGMQAHDNLAAGPSSRRN